MKLIFESSVKGRRCTTLPKCDVPEVKLPENMRRAKAPRLPELSETDISRHYTKLIKRTYGVNNGFYPLGSCTMKYSPRINEEMAVLPGFAGIHPWKARKAPRRFPADTSQSGTAAACRYHAIA